MEIATKEIELLKKETNSKLEEVKKLEISNSEQVKIATDFLGQIKTLSKTIKEKKEAITKPMMTALNEVRDLFKPIETLHSEAEGIIKNKMLAFQRAEAERIRKEEEKIMSRVEKGTMKTETAMNKLENVGEVQKSVKSDFGSIATRKVKRFRIVDIDKIPRTFLMVDETAIRRAMMSNIPVEGIEYYEEEIISARGV